MGRTFRIFGPLTSDEQVAQAILDVVKKVVLGGTKDDAPEAVRRIVRLVESHRLSHTDPLDEEIKGLRQSLRIQSATYGDEK